MRSTDRAVQPARTPGHTLHRLQHSLLEPYMPPRQTKLFLPFTTLPSDKPQRWSYTGSDCQPARMVTHSLQLTTALRKRPETCTGSM